MNEKEKQEVESIRFELLEMFKDSTMLPSIIFRVTSRLWKLSHRKDKDAVLTPVEADAQKECPLCHIEANDIGSYFCRNCGRDLCTT